MFKQFADLDQLISLLKNLLKNFCHLSDSFETEIHPDQYPTARRNESIVEWHCLQEVR